MTSAPTPLGVLVTRDEALAHAWAEEFEEWAPDVDIRTTPIESALHDVDAVISAGNSYGEMNGGVDLALATALPQVQKQVWQRIAEQYYRLSTCGHRRDRADRRSALPLVNLCPHDARPNAID
ncbi:MAG: hypothetical protein Q4C87_09720 [Actinomycetaceae bacterium]|nr:hypothetical protein [Actinomycetaceae bacterium]